MTLLCTLTVHSMEPALHRTAEAILRLRYNQQASTACFTVIATFFDQDIGHMIRTPFWSVAMALKQEKDCSWQHLLHKSKGKRQSFQNELVYPPF